MPFNGGPLDGQEVTPEALSQVDQGGGLDLASLMQGMGGGGPGGPPPGLGGPPPGGPPAGPEPDADEQLSHTDRIKRVLDDLMILSGSQSDWSEQDKAAGQQAMTLVQKIRANEEKMHNDALGGKIAPQLLKRQFAGAGG